MVALPIPVQLSNVIVRYRRKPLGPLVCCYPSPILNDRRRCCSTSIQEELGAAEFALSTKAFDVKQTRQLASEITQRGAQLYDALEAEHELRDLRQKAITRNMDMDEIEACVHEAMAEVTEGI
eukprot:265124-Pyramimonas_sp.AAC.1